MKNNVKYEIGIPEKYRESTVLLYDQAFGKKLSVAIKNPEVRKKIFSESLDLDYGIAAIIEDKLVGIAGFSVKGKSLTNNVSFNSLLSNLGILKGLWAVLIFGLYERKTEPKQIVMDGLSVDEKYRGRKIGENLLNKLIEYAIKNNFENIRLDVIDINPKAKKLYEKIGFKTIRSEHFSYLRWLLGFGRVDTMLYNITENKN